MKWMLLVPSLTLLPTAASLHAAPLSIANHSFEHRDADGDGLGGFFGWNFDPAPGPNGMGKATEATPSSLTPPGGAHDGMYFIWGRVDGAGANPARVFQRLDVSAFATEIDAGFKTASFTSYGFGDDVNNDNEGDFAQMRVAFFDSVVGGSQLGGDFNSNIAIAPAVWTAMVLDNLNVPIGTRSIELSLLVARPLGSFNDAAFDDVSGALNTVPEPSSLTLAFCALLVYTAHQAMMNSGTRILQMLSTFAGRIFSHDRTAIR